MRRFFAVFLIFVLAVSLCVSVLAVEPDELVELTYWEWCTLYSLCDCTNHHDEYLGIKSYNGGQDDSHPALISFAEYNAAFPGRVENPLERNYEIGTEKELYDEDASAAGKYFNSTDFAARYGNLNLGSLLTDYISKEAMANIAEARQADALAAEAESDNDGLSGIPNDVSDVPVLSASALPDSGSAYSQPVLVATEYAPDAQDGSLLSVLYGLLGKPVKSYTYSYASDSSAQTVYKLELLDYDVNWIASFLMLCLVLYCVFKAGGALLSKL